MERNRITVFTPTYNRGYILPKLYHSLCSQTSKKFCWFIVDDGSGDETEKLVQSWMEEKKINIQYIRQKNAGKSQAHNVGVRHTETELFVCVDSDDQLTPNAIERVLKYWNEDSSYVGILAFHGTGTKCLTTLKTKADSCTLREAYRKYGLSGDTLLVYRTDLIAKYEFPQFKGEKFVPEGYLYDLLDQEGELHILPEVLCIGDYLEDGYTANIRAVIAQNPKGYLAFIGQRLKKEKELRYKVEDTIRYVAVKLCLEGKKKRIVSDAVYPCIAVLCLMPGYLFYCRAYKKEIKHKKTGRKHVSNDF